MLYVFYDASFYISKNQNLKKFFKLQWFWVYYFDQLNGYFWDFTRIVYLPNLLAKIDHQIA